MLLPDLPPDIVLPSLAPSANDIDFSFEVKRAALGPYVSARWGWDEEFQRRLHEQHLNEKPFSAIVCSGERIGTLSLMRVDDHLRFGEFYLWPAWQKKGLGTRILQHCTSIADQMGCAMRLEYLQWNPVGRLYERHGFKVVGETETHWLMERDAAPAPTLPSP